MKNIITLALGFLSIAVGGIITVSLTTMEFGSMSEYHTAKNFEPSKYLDGMSAILSENPLQFGFGVLLIVIGGILVIQFINRKHVAKMQELTNQQ